MKNKNFQYEVGFGQGYADYKGVFYYRPYSRSVNTFDERGERDAFANGYSKGWKSAFEEESKNKGLTNG